MKIFLKKHPFALLLGILLMFIMLCYSTNKPLNLFHDTEFAFVDSSLVMQVHLVSRPIEKNNSWRYFGEIECAYFGDSALSLPSRRTLLLYVAKDSLMALPRDGDILLISSKIARPAPVYPNFFDYGTYLRKQHVLGTSYVDSQSWERVGYRRVRTLRHLASECQQWLVSRFEYLGLRGRVLAITSALTVGYREQLDAETRQSFTNAGAMHILAVSGLHTGIVFSIIVALLTLFGRYKPLYDKRWRKMSVFACSMVALWSYAFITGLSPSILRASLMLTIAELGYIFNRHGIGLNTVFASAFIILIINPLALFSVSFQFSYSAVLGILLLGPTINAQFPVRGRWVYVRDLITISLAAQLGTMSIALYYFSQTSNYFWLTNLVVLPLAYPIIVLAGLALLLSFCPIGFWLAWLLGKTVSFLCAYVEWIERLPGAITHIPISLIMCILLYVAIVFGYLAYKQIRPRWMVGTVASLLLFCALYWKNIGALARTDKVIFQGNTVYYERGTHVEEYPVEKVLFARHHDSAYAFVASLPHYKMALLEDYCQENNITIEQ